MTNKKLPAEWERHEATFITWPHNRDDWPGKMRIIPLVYAEMIRKIVPHEEVIILVADKLREDRARRVLTQADVDLAHVKFWRIATDRSWIRDYGPITIFDNGERRLVDFRFNAWGRYRKYDSDNRVPEIIASKCGGKKIIAQYDKKPVVLEGGAIDSNGAGTIVTTEECLLDNGSQVRNRGFSRNDYEKLFADMFGVSSVIWLGRGIIGDDTHGHVDDICRFVNMHSLVTARTDQRDNKNYRAMEENRERLQDARLADGSRPEVIDLPLPTPLRYKGVNLPASYLNFYISNRAVLVPTFNDKNDPVALGILAEIFPGREVVGIHAVDLIWGLGAVHCLTMQLPEKSKG